ncbi:MAG: VOC family protein [Pyrinomonadaceae bacterium]|nr:VOC family protein [Pyrinomonadaceae bacterium]
MLQGLRTVSYKVDDLAAAKKWYTSLLGFGPYFDEPFYVGFNVGGYELGLDPDSEGAIRGDSPVAYWGVGDITSAIEKLRTDGTEIATEPMDVGGDIKVASVHDPFGNLIGLIENPHFKIKERS